MVGSGEHGGENSGSVHTLRGTVGFSATWSLFVGQSVIQSIIAKFKEWEGRSAVSVSVHFALLSGSTSRQRRRSRHSTAFELIFNKLEQTTA